MEYILKKLEIKDKELIKSFFVELFTKEPWNDDWSDETQLDAYLTDLCGCFNSLTFGFFQSDKLIGISMGRVKHWYTGTEYCVDEFGICRDMQGRGVGTQFMKAMEKYLVNNGIVQIYLQTDKDVPAYDFYRKNGFTELSDNVSFAKYLK